MTYEEYQARGYFYSDYMRLSQWQRLRGLIMNWRKSTAPDKCIRLAAMWDKTDEEHDWIRIDDWWHPRQWRYWKFGIDQCQNFERICLGPMTILLAT